MFDNGRTRNWTGSTEKRKRREAAWQRSWEAQQRKRQNEHSWWDKSHTCRPCYQSRAYNGQGWSKGAAKCWENNCALNHSDFSSTEQVCNLTIGNVLYTFCNASYNITVFHLHFTIYSKYTFTVLYFFPHRIARQPHRGGRGPLFAPEQEQPICTMVVEINAIRLREIKSAIMEDNNIFENIQTVSISIIDRVLK